MYEKIKPHLESASWTFLATFATVVGTSLSAAGHVEWSGAFWGGILLASVRAAVKAVGPIVVEFVRSYLPVALGGKK